MKNVVDLETYKAINNIKLPKVRQQTLAKVILFKPFYDAKRVASGKAA
jgi:hypothetical protein